MEVRTGRTEEQQPKWNGKDQFSDKQRCEGVKQEANGFQIHFFGRFHISIIAELFPAKAMNFLLNGSEKGFLCRPRLVINRNNEIVI